MRKIIALLALSMIGLVIAACGSSASSSHPAAASPGPNTSTSSGSTITCADISSDLSTVVSDEKTEQAQLQEAWVSGGKSADLQSLINDTNGATSGSQLNNDAATFNSDASTYLSDNSPYLAPGWEQGYDTVWNDINTLASDCNQAGAGRSRVAED